MMEAMVAAPAPNATGTARASGLAGETPTTVTTSTGASNEGPSTTHTGKRKAESQDNERLSKRLSLLNLERNGSKLYVPVETPSSSTTTTTCPPLSSSLNPKTTSKSPSKIPKSQIDDSVMQVDDSKHKVYIYNIDDELSSESGDDGENSSEAGSGDGKLVFLPDIDKHLRANRIPPHILANDEGELAGMQLVLYDDPKSLTVPESKDSVRKAIIESRNRLRESQKLERGESVKETLPVANVTAPCSENDAMSTSEDSDAMDMD